MELFYAKRVKISNLEDDKINVIQQGSRGTALVDYEHRRPKWQITINCYQI